VSATTVLYDVPGPRSRARHRVAGGIGALGVVAIAALAVLELAAAGQLDSSTWRFVGVEGTWIAIRDGLINTLQVAAVAIALALGFGALFAVGRLSRRAYLRWPAVAVVEFFRATPLLLLILFLFLGFGDTIGRFWSLTLALVLYNGSVLAEIFRAGILSVPRGQAEAAYALGMRKAQVMRSILIPQAVSIMLPAIISQSVVALKDSALGLIIAYDELARAGRQIYVFYNNPLAVGLLIAAIYVVINATLSQLAVALEARQRRRVSAG
jgi:glutamate transport system permease protein